MYMSFFTDWETKCR